VITAAVGLNLIFIPLYGITGAAFATLGAYSIFNLIKFLFILIRFKLQPFNHKNLLVLIIGAVSYLLIGSIPLDFHYLVNILILLQLLHMHVNLKKLHLKFMLIE
jgi:O-antigen/teichoic acid export membrane protein